MRKTWTTLSAAIIAVSLTTPVMAGVILSDTFSRTTGNANVDTGPVFSDWGAVDNGLGGAASANYLTTNATNPNQQTVGDGVGQIRFGRTILDYNFAADPQVQAAGGIRISFQINPTDAGGAGIAGRDWGGVLLSDTNSTVTIGGPAAAANTNASARFSVVPRNSGSLLYKRMNPNLVPLTVGNPFLPTFNEPIFDLEANNEYKSVPEATRTSDGFINPAVYQVEIEVLSSFAAGAASTARAFIGRVGGPLAEMDFDYNVAGVQPAVFTWGTNGGAAYLVFVGNASTHTFDNLVVSVIPEPGGLMLLGVVAPLLLRRRSVA